MSSVFYLKVIIQIRDKSYSYMFHVQVYPSRSHVTSSRILILDGFPRVYVWIGRDSGFVLRNKVHCCSR